MRLRFRLLIPVLAACASPLLIEAQTQGVFQASASSNGNLIQGTVTLSGRQMMGPPITGAPYSAERVVEHVQIGFDGTRFTSTDRRETIYRDSQGRMRSERTLMIGPNPQPADAPLLVEIEDPVTGVSYTLDTQNKVAHRIVMQTRATAAGTVTAQRSAPAATAARPPRPETANEDLGKQTIEGVVADGHRTTQTWAAGALGNDRAFQSTTEYWFSPDIREAVLTKSSDPRSGESTTKLINISRSEPSLDLFKPPADYSIVDETGKFEIHWTAHL